MDDATKVCSRCREVKPLWEFKEVGDDTADGRGLFCVDCRPRKTNSKLYLELFRKQRGVCAVCGSSGNQGKLVLDWNYANGKVRGLVCRRCLQTVNVLNDEPDSAKRMLEYLLGIE